MKILAIFAHPDDEMIFGWPVFQNKNIEKFLICVTGNDDRQKALTEVSKLLDFQFLCLNIEDKQVDKHQEELNEAIDNAIDIIHPDFVFCHNPWGEYQHPDHIAIYDTVVNNKNINFILLTDISISLDGSGFPKTDSSVIENYPEIYDSSNLLLKSNRHVKLYKTIRDIYRSYNCWTWGKRDANECGIYVLKKNNETLHRKHIISLLTSMLLGSKCIGAEIGVFKGETTAYLSGCKHIKMLYAIDSWKEDDLYKDSNDMIIELKRDSSLGSSIDADSWDGLYEYVEDRFKDKKNVYVIRKKSKDAVSDVDKLSNFFGNLLDFVFIDSNHDQEYVLEDLSLWEPLVRSGGLLIGHDFSRRHKGVIRALIEYFTPEKSALFEDVHDINRSDIINRSDDFIWWRQKR